MSETFVTSDQHWGHANIIEYCDRPFVSVEEMTEGMVTLWNVTVGPQDVVWVLGDWCLGKLAETLPITKRLNGILRLVPGNHDKCHPKRKGYRPAFKTLYTDAGFSMIVDPPLLRRVAIGGHLVDLCHFPYAGDHTAQDRYVDERPTDEGRWLLHGHIHDLWAEQPEQRMINVGCDVRGYRPMHADEVASLIADTG